MCAHMRIVIPSYQTFDWETAGNCSAGLSTIYICTHVCTLLHMCACVCVCRVPFGVCKLAVSWMMIETLLQTSGSLPLRFCRYGGKMNADSRLLRHLTKRQPPWRPFLTNSLTRSLSFSPSPFVFLLLRLQQVCVCCCCCWCFFFCAMTAALGAGRWSRAAFAGAFWWLLRHSRETVVVCVAWVYVYFSLRANVCVCVCVFCMLLLLFLLFLYLLLCSNEKRTARRMVSKRCGESENRKLVEIKTSTRMKRK